MKHILYPFLVLIILAAACTDDDNTAPATDAPADYIMEISATRQAPDVGGDADTRAQYTFNQSGGSYSWEGDEEIGLFILGADGQILHSNLKFTAIPGSLSVSKASVDFSGTIPGGQPPLACTYYAVYPYSADCKFKVADDKHWIDVHIPPRQTALRPPLLASAIDGDSENGQTLNMNFAAMCSFAVLPKIKFTSSQSDWSTNISEVRIRSGIKNANTNNYTHIAGTGVVDMKTFVIHDKSYPLNCWSRTVGTIFPSAVNVKNGSEISAIIMTKEFVMASITGGITIDVVTADGWMATKTFLPREWIGFTRNRATVLPELIIDTNDFRHARIDDSTQPEYNMQGDGSAGNPFKLVKGSQLLGMATFLNDKPLNNRHVRLEIDIDIQTTTWTPLAGVGFYTVFDGNYHTINGKMINTEYEGRYGLFDDLVDSTVKNLEITADIEASMSGDVGALAGYCSNSTIENCTFSGRLVHRAAEDAFNIFNIGGFVGQMKSGHMKDCKMAGQIYVAKNPAVLYVGGLAGAMQIEPSLYIYNNEITGRIEIPTGTTRFVFVAPVAGELSSSEASIFYCQSRFCPHCIDQRRCDLENEDCICEIKPGGGSLTIQNNKFTGYIYYETESDMIRNNMLCYLANITEYPYPQNVSGNTNAGEIICITP